MILITYNEQRGACPVCYLDIIQFNIVVRVVGQIGELCVIIIIVITCNIKLKENNFTGELAERIVKTERIITTLGRFQPISTHTC